MQMGVTGIPWTSRKKKKTNSKNSWKKSEKHEYNLFFGKVNAIAMYQLCN